MALVPYNPRNSLMPYSSPYGMNNFSLSRSYKRPRRFLATTTRRRYSRYRNKMGIINTNTNPVYPRPEVKFLDTNIGILGTPQFIVNTGVFFSVNNITPGTGISQRVGNQVATKSVYYQFVLNFGTSATPVPIALRHMLVWDRQPNSALISAASTLLNTSSSAIVGPMNIAYRDRFVVLADDRLTLSPQGDNIRIINGYRPINQKTVYDDATGPIPSTGALFVFFASDETNAAPTQQPSVYGTWRVRYMDN